MYITCRSRSFATYQFDNNGRVVGGISSPRPSPDGHRSFSDLGTSNSVRGTDDDEWSGSSIPPCDPAAGGGMLRPLPAFARSLAPSQSGAADAGGHASGAPEEVRLLHVIQLSSVVGCVNLAVGIDSREFFKEILACDWMAQSQLTPPSRNLPKQLL